jgi:hypothetical protein
MWYPLVADARPPLGAWLGVIFASLFVGLVVPALLLGMDTRTTGATRPNVRGPFIRPSPKRDE